MSASASWTTQREVLAVEGLRRTGRLRLQVRGESMLPAVWPGDVVEVETTSLSDVRRGEIVLAYREGRFFLHRFLRTCESGGFLARGDSMPGADPAYSSENLLGKLVGVERAGKMVTVRPLRSWSRLLGILFCYCNWARQLALRVHRLVNASCTDELHLYPSSGLCNREAR